MRRPSSALKSSNRKLALAFLLLCVSALCLYRLSGLPFIRARVTNESDPAVLQARRLPGFIEQAPGSAGLIAFRRHTVSLAVEGGDDFSRAIAIQHWVRKQESDRQFYRQPGQKTGPEIDKTESPEEYLQQQRRGIRSACRRFSYILTGALLSHGIDARVVSTSNVLDRFTPLAHNVVEVWIPPLNKWVVFDPTFDAVVLVNGNPASALEVYRAAFLFSDRRITLAQHGASYRCPPLHEYRLYFRHMFYARTNAVFDGYRYGLFSRKSIDFIHYIGPQTVPYPQAMKTGLLFGTGISFLFSVLLSADWLLRIVLASFSSHRSAAWLRTGVFSSAIRQARLSSFSAIYRPGVIPFTRIFASRSMLD
jgi:hypothetical protein